ncbi:MAG TPA: tyrosine-type recombinase/integrase, partial [Lacipirellula sp.]
MQRQIAQFLTYLRVERGASPHTLKGYREDLIAAADYFAEEDGSTPEPSTITAVELRGFLSALHDAGYAKTSIARKLASLRSFYKYGQREGWASSNPARALRNPRKGRSLPHFLTTEEIGKLLAAPPAGSPMGLRDRAILETMYSAGLRVSELVGLSDGDVDLAQGVLLVRGKGRRERISPLGSYALRALQAWLKMRTVAKSESQGREAPVFTNRFGTRLTTRSVGRMLEK